jgi:hypothetical protein
MPFILKTKETKQYRLFGSLPILCRSIGFDEKQEKGLSYVFSQKNKDINSTKLTQVKSLLKDVEEIKIEDIIRYARLIKRYIE